MSDLRKLDEEIARLRGWTVKHFRGQVWRCEREGEWWFPPKAAPDWESEPPTTVEGLGCALEPPPFSRGGALTWGLFEEWIGDNELDDLCGEMYRRGDSTPGEVVAEAWVAWRRGRA